MNKLKIFDLDSDLKIYEDRIEERLTHFKKMKDCFLNGEKKISDLAKLHKYLGFTKTRTGWIYREWAPEADRLYLTGDFNNWSDNSHPLERINDKYWEIHIKGIKTIPNNSRLKLIVEKNGVKNYRIPLFINKVKLEKNNGGEEFFGLLDNPPRKYEWKIKNFKLPRDFSPIIYECHIGIGQEKEDIGTYKDFLKILPRIKSLGYNSIQIMGLISHINYSSFGYDLTNFFSLAPWYGDNKDLKALIDKAHELGLGVFIDINHFQASKNIEAGIDKFDGTDNMFFQGETSGDHPIWDAKLFNYKDYDVQLFLLSNLAFYLEKYKVDGFKFNNVNSIIYKDHGINRDHYSYDDYFSDNVDLDGLTYLYLANNLIKEINPRAISLAEEVSGMPCISLPIKDGGIGFDYKFNMGVSNLWSILLNKNDHDWDMNWIWYELNQNRPEERSISYSENHNQSIMGNKPIFTRLSGDRAYWNMSKEDSNYIIFRAISLHKLIRLATLSTAKNGYLNFMGNEFGHPDWIEMPCEINNWSFKYARRQWSLVDDKKLKFQYLNQFDKDMIHFIKEKKVFKDTSSQLIMVDNDLKIIYFKRNNHYFLFNFHPTRSYEGLRLPVFENGSYKVVFDTDNSIYGGVNRISKDFIYTSEDLYGSDYDYSIQIYLPSRTALILSKLEE